jgi:hypothetical protein
MTLNFQKITILIYLIQYFPLIHRKGFGLLSPVSIGLIAVENYLSGVDPNIKPQNTNKIVEFTIFSRSFIDTDIQSISKFEFGSLSKIVINVKNLRNCLSLNHLQKISKNADYVKILISKSEGINSSCLIKNQIAFA